MSTMSAYGGKDLVAVYCNRGLEECGGSIGSPVQPPPFLLKGRCLEIVSFFIFIVRYRM